MSIEKPTELKAKKADLSEWYSQVLEVAELIDKRYIVKGSFVWLPYGFKLINNLKKYWDSLFQEAGIQEVYFPLLVPKEYAMINDGWYEGFKTQAFWVTDYETKKSDYILRPTGEPAMYPMFQLWIKAKGLPIRVYQTVNSYRYETKHTRPIIRDREITFWHEIHTAHSTKEEAEKEMAMHIKFYEKIYENLALPYLEIVKPIWECFPGAEGAIEFYNVMPNGMVMENGSVNNLGQAYAKKFDLFTEVSKGRKDYVWQLCTGNGARFLAAAFLIHGDDRGLVLPPRIAPIKVVIVPIIFNESRDEILDKVNEISLKIGSLGFQVTEDFREKNPGSKFYDWEIKGVPLRVEIGPKEMRQKSITVVRRDTGKRMLIKEEDIPKRMPEIMEEIQSNLLTKARQMLQEKICFAGSFSEIREIIRNQKIAKAPWCGQKTCYEEISQLELGFEPIGSDVRKSETKKCIACGKETREALYVARSY
jgi:prolyl-tRNA synthetase